jgi:uncharacterized protein (DUF1778 family)
MANSSESTIRVTARISVGVQEILQRAAELSGATLNLVYLWMLKMKLQKVTTNVLVLSAWKMHY